MADIKRTTEGLEHCLARYVDGLCDDCPYMGEIDRSYMIPMKCKEIIMRDALELLKEQQAINDHLSKGTERLNKLLDRKTAEIERLKRKSRWIVNTKKYGEDNYHCLLCGAIVEKDEAGRHYWQRCYHCGAYMELMDGTDRDYDKEGGQE